MLSTYNNVADAVFKDVIFQGDGSTKIVAGIPVCYNFNTTDNVLGYSAANDSSLLTGNFVEASTTAEGYQNEGKFIYVEVPSTDNILWFAGIISKDSNGLGTTPASGVNVPIQIQVPNGAIGYVLSGITTVVGRTVLSVLPTVAYLGNPLNALRGRPVAIAEETVVGTTSAPVLCLARICPSEFVNQLANSSSLIIGDGVTTEVAMCPNTINVSSTQTDGDFTAFKVIGEITAAGGSCGNGAIQMKCLVNSTSQGTPPTMYAAGGVSTMIQFATGATATGIFYAGRFCCLNQDNTPATVSGAYIYNIISSMSTNTNAPAELAHMRFESDGSSKPGYFFVAKSNEAVCYAAASSISNVGTLKIKVNGVDKYIVLSSAP